MGLVIAKRRLLLRHGTHCDVGVLQARSVQTEARAAAAVVLAAAIARVVVVVAVVVAVASMVVETAAVVVATGGVDNGIEACVGRACEEKAVFIIQSLPRGPCAVAGYATQSSPSASAAAAP